MLRVTGISTIRRNNIPAMNTPPSNMSREAFISTFGSLYEHSPWVAERVFDAGPQDSPEQLHGAFRGAVLNSDRNAQLRLLRAHPELACSQAGLSGASRGEQAGAGLDACSQAEFDELRELNQRYQERFGFPFIVAVRGLDRHQILSLFRQRIEHDADLEFGQALEQVCQIGRHRLMGYFNA